MLKSIPPTPAERLQANDGKFTHGMQTPTWASATLHQGVPGGNQLDGTRQRLEGGRVLGTPSPTPCSPSRLSGMQLQEISSLALKLLMPC